MSIITIIVVKNKKITLSELPISDCLRIAKQGFVTIPPIIHKSASKYLDVGYILIDYDQNIILSNQQGFASSHLLSSTRMQICSRWDYIEKY